MNNHRLFLFYPFLMIGCISCAQARVSIRHLYAVFQVHFPGNVAVNENGKEIAPRDTVRFVYVETATSGIQWQAAWDNGRQYAVNVTLLGTGDYNAGTFSKTNGPMLLHAAPGHRLWQLQLTPSDRQQEPPKNIAPGEILLRGSIKGKVLWERVGHLEELNAIPSQ